MIRHFSILHLKSRLRPVSRPARPVKLCQIYLKLIFLESASSKTYNLMHNMVRLDNFHFFTLTAGRCRYKGRPNAGENKKLSNLGLIYTNRSFHRKFQVSSSKDGFSIHRLRNTVMFSPPLIFPHFSGPPYNTITNINKHQHEHVYCIYIQQHPHFEYNIHLYKTINKHIFTNTHTI